MKIISLFFIVSFLSSCLLKDNFEPNKPYVDILIYNYTIENINIDIGKRDYFNNPLYIKIKQDGSTTVSVNTGIEVIAIGEVTGEVYGTRKFPFEGKYTWIINR